MCKGVVSVCVCECACERGDLVGSCRLVGFRGMRYWGVTECSRVGFMVWVDVSGCRAEVGL